MSLPHLPRPLKGIVPPVVTPLAAPNELDRAGLERLVEHILAGGVHGIFILGTTGEGPALGYALRRELIERVCSQVENRVPVLVGITDTAYAEALSLGEFAAKAGAAAVVMAPPYYFRASQSDLLRWIEGAAKESPLPLYLYNMPGLTKMNYGPDIVAAAAEIPNVYGLKDSSGDMVYLKTVLKLVKAKQEFSVLVGPEYLLAESLLNGVHGGVNGGANLFPRLFVDLFEAFAAGKITEMQRLQQRVSEMGDVIYGLGEPESSYIRGLKGALSVLGICSGLPAWPYVAAQPNEILEIQRHLKNYVQENQNRIK